ncbi:MAG TPA: glycerate kinase, partial [Acidimicrobiales bacterium]
MTGGPGRGTGGGRGGGVPRVVVAPDKFRGTVDARQAAAAMAWAVTDLGWEAVVHPLSDGGEGLLDACADVCPDVVSTTVSGPDGMPVVAEWRFGDGMAVVESARASGLTLAGGPERNDPMAATTRGTGELLVAAARKVGAGGTVVVGLGGSATTDGG